METMAEQLIQKGDYLGALRLLDAEVRTQPTSETCLMIFNLRTRIEDYDQALAALEMMVRLEPELANAADFLRDCAEAERLRTLRGKDAELAGARNTLGRTPPPSTLLFTQAAVLHAQGLHEEAATTLTEAMKPAQRVSGTLTRTNGAVQRFTDLTDSDDLTGPHLPCFHGRTVLDVPYCELKEVRFAPPRSSMDATWVPALLVPWSGAPREVRVFSFYAGTGRHGSEPVRMGHMTVWAQKRGYSEGAGQRDLKLMSGEGHFTMVGILQVARIVFDGTGATQDEEEEGKPKRKGLLGRLFG